MLSFLRRSFVRGLGIVLPALVTVWVAVWFVRTSEDLVGGAARRLLPEGWYVTGTGLVLMLVLVLLAGVVAHGWLADAVGGAFSRLMQRIPMLGAVYDSLRDIAHFATGDRKDGMDEVVLVTLPSFGSPLLGFVTGAVAPIEGDDRIAVYLPMSYQLGGYTVFVDRSCCRPVDMTREEAMRFTLTAGIARRAAPSQAEGR